MGFASSSPAPTEPVLAGIDVSAEPTNQEDVVLPYFAGQATLPAHWVSPAYNRRPVEAPNSAPAKK